MINPDSKLLLIFLCCAAGSSAQPAGSQYVGAKLCGSCHARRLEQQSASAHAGALRPLAEHPLARLFTKEVNERMPAAQWAFGAGDQAVTFVSQLDEDSYLEHRFSFYTRSGHLDLTPGHPARTKAGHLESEGVMYETFDPEAKIMRCFQCHSTGRLSLGERMQLIPGELGVRCEACHGPGKAHVDAIKAGRLSEARRAIQNPGRMNAVDQNQFCGDCHRKPQQGETATNWNDAWNTRHQPLYLAQSACFRKSNGKLTCLTCHDPHEPLRRNEPEFYNSKCAGCHASKPHSILAPAEKTDDCIRCHMPAVSPREHLQFLNHWIGVYRAGSSLKPIRSY